MGSAKSLQSDQSARARRALLDLRIYESRNVLAQHFSDWSMTNPDLSIEGDGDDYDDLVLNKARAACHSIQAKLAGRQKPKPQFLTSGAEWSLKRRAQRLDKFVEGTLHQQQGQYADSWELAQDVLLDCAIWGTGAIKVFPGDERICHERVFAATELFVDPVEARYGNPQTLFQICLRDKEQLKTQFPEKADLIEGASISSGATDDAMNESLHNGSYRISDSVRVVEVWKLSPGGDKPGRHVIAIDNATIVDEDWTRAGFPFVFMHWQRERVGFWSCGLIGEIRALQDRLDETLQSIVSSIDKGSKLKVFVEKGSQVDDADLMDPDEGVIVEYTGKAPIYHAPNAVSSDQLTLLQLLGASIFELTGVSEANATSRKESGVESGVALRLLNDQETERFSVLAKRYEMLFVELAKQDIECMAELADDDADFTVSWHGDGFLSEINWNDSKIEDNQYHVQVYPVSSLPSTPAGRIATIQELIGTGMIPQEVGAELLGWPDLEQYGNRVNSVRKLTERLIESFLDFGTDDQGDEWEYKSPDPHMIHGGLLGQVLAQVAQAYFEAMLNDAPETNLDFFRKYIEECVLIAEKAAAGQQAEQQANAGPSGAVSPVPSAGPQLPPGANPAAAA